MAKNPHADFSPTLLGYTGQGAFRFWCQMALPLTYDDSLSYYELLNKVVTYLNNTIEDVANVETNVDALSNAYNQLQKYVNDYFDDLDVEEELRNVLDKMALDGSLDAILTPLVEAALPDIVDDKIDNVVADQIDDVVAEQIDDVVENQLPPLVEDNVPDAVSNWLSDNVDPVGSAVVVDSTLTISGAAADAKVTGDEIANLNTQFSDLVIDKNLLNTCEEYKVGWMGNADALAEYPSGSVWAFIPVTANTGYKCNFDARFIHYMGMDKTQSETNTERLTAGTTFTPQYNGYVHITILNSATNYNNAKMCLASENFDDVAKYGYCYINNKYVAQTLSDATKAQIETTVSTPIKQALSFVKSYKVDDSIYNSGVLSNVTTDFDITDGAYIRQDGSEGSASGYQRTDYIDIEDIDGVIVYAYNPGTSGNATYAVYDANQNLLGSSITSIEDGLITAFALSLEYPNVKYIRFCCYYGSDNSKKLKFQKHAGTDTVSEKIQEIEAEENPLKGKKLAVDGDSICYGAGYTGGYAKIIGDRNSMTVQNLAVGGATLASGTGKHIICESMMNLDNDADYIIIEGGVNDSANGVTIGNFTAGYNNTLNTAYFYGAIETVCKQLSIKFAGKKYGFLIPHQMADTMKPAWKEGLGTFHDAVVKACTKWGVPLLDLSVEVPPFEGFAYSGNSDLVAVADAYTADTTSSGHGDGWHPNENGYKKYYVDKIEAWLKSM